MLSWATVWTLAVGVLKLRRAERWEVERLRVIADYQFGLGAGACLIPDDALLGISPNTLRVREVRDGEGRLLATLRANDYFYSLSLEGARRLLECFEPPRLRALIDPRLAPHNSIPSRAVIEVDEGLRAGDEVIVVDERDSLLGVGRLRLSPLEIKAGVYGEAIRLRRRVR